MGLGFGFWCLGGLGFRVWDQGSGGKDRAQGARKFRKHRTLNTEEEAGQHRMWQKWVKGFGVLRVGGGL